jgi:hypothetical protein
LRSRYASPIIVVIKETFFTRRGEQIDIIRRRRLDSTDLRGEFSRVVSGDYQTGSPHASVTILKIRVDEEPSKAGPGGACAAVAANDNRETYGYSFHQPNETEAVAAAKRMLFDKLAGDGHRRSGNRHPRVV